MRFEGTDTYIATDDLMMAVNNDVLLNFAVTVALFVASYVLLRLRLDGWAFAATALTIVAGSAVAFEGLFPRVLPSTLNPAWDLTIYNASSSPLTLKVMLIVVIMFLPGVLAYQAWSYWVFRQRVTAHTVGSH